MKRFLALAALLCIANPAAAEHDHASHPGKTHGVHDMPVHPVHVRMLVDPGRIRVRIITDGAILANELLGMDLPASNWPESKKHDAQLWIEEQFTLSCDGKKLGIELLDASYRIDAWKKVADVGTVGWDGMFVFDIAYNLPPDAKTLTGRAAFYEDDWIHLESLLEKGATPLFRKNFLTVLDVPGKHGATLKIGIEKPEFSLPLETAMRTGQQRVLEAAGIALQLPWPVLYALLALLLLIAGAPMRIGMGGFITAMLLFAAGPVPAGPLSNAAPWLALSLTAAAALKKPSRPRSWILWVSGLCGGFLGIGWCSMQNLLSQIPMNPLAGRLGFIAGSLIAAGVTGGLAFFAYRGGRAYLCRESEQMGDKLLEKNGRFAAFGLGMLGAVYAARALLGL